MATRIIPFLLASLLVVSCGSEPAPPAAPPAEKKILPAPVPDDRPIIVAFGDSLSAGYGVEEGSSYPDFLRKALDEAGYAYRVVNAGISGDTTSGGLTRVSTITALSPVLVILELGGNDGLRGLPIATTRSNLEEMILELKTSGAIVVLAGMTLPPNYGPDYIREFEEVYTGLAATHSLPLIPFLLEGVAGNRDLMQSDGIHPTAEGNRLAAANVMEVIAPLLARIEGKRAGVYWGTRRDTGMEAL